MHTKNISYFVSYRLAQHHHFSESALSLKLKEFQRFRLSLCFVHNRLVIGRSLESVFLRISK